MSQRDTYYLQTEVYNDKSQFEPFMESFSNGTESVLVIDGRTKAQLRANYSEFTYDQLSDQSKQIAWLISAADAVAMPILDHPGNYHFYYTWYTGFQTGTFYSSPGPYNVSNLGYPERLQNPNTGCEATDPPPNNGYDPRCRGWYQQAQGNKNQVILTAPYFGLFPDTNMYITLTSYN